MRRALTVALAAAGLVAGLVPAANAARPSDHGCTWLAGDLHVHTAYSHDSFGGPLYDDEPESELQDFYTAGWTVTEEGALAVGRGLDFLAITDHNNVRSQTDPGWDLWSSLGLTMVPGYENSIGGHAQMLGATKVYSNAGGPPAVATSLRADGGAFQINHPADLEWHDAQGNYKYPGFYPDALEIWNIGAWVYQPPAPATNDHEFPIDFYDSLLDEGAQIAATGGSDTHWRSTTAAQGVGQPTTWVCADVNSPTAVVDGIEAGRTTISHQPPAYGGPFATLEADGDGNGSFESDLGDTVPAGASVRATVGGAPGATLRIVTDGSTTLSETLIDSPSFTHTLTVPEGSTWVRAEVFYEDGADVRSGLQFVCDVVATISGNFGDEYANVTYCRNRLAVVAMTSPIYSDAA
ncbi:MAG TPA: CehA/McbA family metallohydrolase, partial [Actinomycetota bacterium]